VAYELELLFKAYLLRSVQIPTTIKSMPTKILMYFTGMKVAAVLPIATDITVHRAIPKTTARYTSIGRYFDAKLIAASWVLSPSSIKNIVPIIRKKDLNIHPSYCYLTYTNSQAL